MSQCPMYLCYIRRLYVLYVITEEPAEVRQAISEEQDGWVNYLVALLT